MCWDCITHTYLALTKSTEIESPTLWETEALTAAMELEKLTRLTLPICEKVINKYNNK